MVATNNISSTNGRPLLSAREAAKRLDCAQDYIGKLCREGKLVGERVNGDWFVSDVSLDTYERARTEAKAIRAQELSELRRKESEDFQAAQHGPVGRVVHGVGNARMMVAASVLVGFALWGAGSALSQTAVSSGATSAAVSQVESPFFGKAPAFSFGSEGGIGDFIRGVFAALFAPKPQTVATNVEPKVETPIVPTVPAPRVETTPSVINQNTYPVIERVVERVITNNVSGVSNDLLTTKLQELSNTLRQEIARMSSGPSGVMLPYAPAFRLDKISGAAISGGSITGANISGGSISGVSISASDVSGVVAISSGGTGTSTAPAYGQVLLGNASGTYDLVATSSLGITSGSGTFVGLTDTPASLAVGDILYASAPNTLSALPIGANGQVLKLSGGLPVWGSDLQGSGGAGLFATTSDSLAIYPSDPSYVALFGNNATTTTGNILEVTGNALFRNQLRAYQTITAPTFSATSTLAASTFPYASSTALTVSGIGYFGTASSTNVRVSGTQTFENLANASLAVNSSGAVYAAATTTFGSGLTYSGGAVTLDRTGAWTGTFDGQEGTWYIDRANHTGTQTASTISDFGTVATANFVTNLAATTSVASITTLANLSITKSQVSDFGTYENPLIFTYPLSRSVNTISLAFGTTTTNSWVHQIFSSLVATNASSTNATSTNLSTTLASTTALRISGTQTFENLANSGLAVNSSGAVYAAATTTYSGGLTYLNGNVTNSGVTSITGTANQITASASTGAVTLSLPTFLAITQASSTQQSILDILSVGRTATTTIRGDGVASILPYASTTALSATSLYSATASSTNLIVSGLNAAGCDLKADVNGVISCGTDATGGGGGGTFAWTPTTNYGAAANSTSTPIWFTSGLQASSTSYLANASTSMLTVGDTAAPTTGTVYFGNGSSNLRYDGSNFLVTGGGLLTAAGPVIAQSNSNVFGLGVKYSAGQGTFNIGATESATPDLIFSNSGGLERARLTNTGNLVTVGSMDIGVGQSYKIGGIAALFASTTNNAVAIGAPEAAAWMIASSTAWYNVAIGSGALASTPVNANAQNNTAIGSNTLRSLTTGFGNVALGSQALYTNTTGSENFALGAGTLYSNTVGNNNIAIGSGAMSANTTGSSNVGIGRVTLTSNTVGEGNVGLGYAALYAATSSNNNTAIGYQAGTAISGDTGEVGTGNTLIGYGAGSSITTGGKNTILGFFSSSGITTGSENILIGNDVRSGLSSTGSRQLNIGNLLFGTNVDSGIGLSPGNIGIGTSSPYAKLSVVGEVAATYFTATTTATSTFPTLFSTNATTTNLYSSGTAMVTSIYGAGLAACDPSTQKLLWSGGVFSCGTDLNTGGGGGSFPFSADTNYGQVVYATTTPTLWFKGGFFASSTSYVVDILSRYSTSTNVFGGRVTGGTAAFGESSTTTISSIGSITLPTAALLTAPYASSTALTATTLYATTASSTNLIVSGLNAAGCDLKANASGVISCGTDATGGGASYGQGWEIDGNGFTGFLAPTTTQKVWIGQASSTLLSVLGSAYFGGTATSTFDSTGALTLVNRLTLSGSTANVALGSNYISGDGDDEGIYVDSSGRVGIGTASPSDRLQVGEGTSDTRLSVMSNSVNQFTAKNSAGNSVKYGATTDATPNAVISNNDGDPIFTVTSAGNVGIGNVSPSQKLNVQGTVAAQIFTATSTTQSSTFPYASSTALTVSGIGYFGTASTTNLTVSGLASTLLSTNGNGVAQSTTVSSPLLFSGSTLSIDSSSATTNGYLSATDWNVFSNKISSTSLSGGAGISYNSSTGVITNTIGYPFPSNATSTLITFSGGITAGGTATFANASSTLASVYDALYVGRTATTTIRGDGVASVLPYASSTVLSVSGIGYFGTATTTALNVSGTATLQNVTSCSGSNALTTNSSGVIACGAIVGSGGASSDFTFETNYNVLSAATTTPIWAQGGIFASSTSHFVNADFGAATTTSFFAGTASSTNLFATNAFVHTTFGVGTTSPMSKLTLNGGDFLQVASGTPTLASSITTGAHTYMAAVMGHYVYTAENAGGLRITDISNPKKPTTVGSYTGINAAVSVAVAGKYAYVGDTTAGLVIIDVSNPTAPTLVGSADIAVGPFGIAVSGKYVYLADFDGGVLAIVDVSNPTLPRRVGAYDPPGSGKPYAVVVQGKYAYVGDAGIGDIHIVDISNPTTPVRVGVYADGSTPAGVYLSGKYLYVADSVAGFYSLDVGNPAAPALVATYNDTGAYYGVAAAGNYVYIADHAGILTVLDITSSTTPRLVGNLSTSGAPQNLVLSGKYAYVPAYDGGLKIVNINGIDSPSASIGSLETNVLNVSEDLIVGGNIRAGGGLDVGLNGIFSRGTISAYVASSTETNPTVANFMGGNVGIGTSTPYAALSVAGQSVFNYITATGTTASTFAGVITSTATGANTFPYASSTALTVSGTGYFGTASSTNLTVSGIPSALLVTNANGVASAYSGIDCTNQFVRDVSANGTGTCATVGAADVSLANLTATDSTLTFSGTYNGSTARTIGLNLSNANTWTALQQFSNASTSLASVYDTLYIGRTATSTIQGSTTGTSTLQGFLTVSGTNSTSTFAGNLAITGDLSIGNSNAAKIFAGTARLFATNHLLSTALGVDALPTLGSSNSAFGTSALGGNTTGGNNTAVGTAALSGNTTGQSNTAVGSGAAGGNGSYNVLMGYLSGVNLSTGYGNTLLGASDVTSLSNLTSGGNSIGIGNNIQFASATANNQLNIGGILFGTLPATTTQFTLPTTGSVGVATSSPFAKFSIHANNGSINTSLFAVGSSTASATTTLFSISNTGDVTLAGVINSTATAATSTFAGGLAIETSGLVYDFSTNNVGIGTSSPLTKLHVVRSQSGTTAYAHSNLTIEDGDGVNALAFTGPSSQEQMIMFGDGGSGNAGGLSYHHPTDTFSLFTNAATRLTIDSTGKTGIGTTTPFGLLSVNPVAGNTGPAFVVGSSTQTLFSVDTTGTTTVGNSSGTGNAVFQFAKDADAWVAGYNASDKSFKIASSTNFSSGVALSIAKTGALSFSSGLTTGTGGNYLCIDTTTYVVSRGNGSVCVTSSQRFKENIQDSNYGLSEILSLRPVTYTYKEETNIGPGTKLGFIAEEVDLLLPEVVTHGNDGQIFGLDYSVLTAVLAKATQELNEKVSTTTAALKGEVDTTKTDVSALNNNLTVLLDDMPELHMDISGLQTAQSSLVSNVSGIQTTQSTISSSIEGLQAGQANLASQVSAMEARTTAYGVTVGEMSENIGSVASAVELLQTQMSSTRERIILSGPTWRIFDPVSSTTLAKLSIGTTTVFEVRGDIIAESLTASTSTLSALCIGGTCFDGVFAAALATTSATSTPEMVLAGSYASTSPSFKNIFTGFFAGLADITTTGIKELGLAVRATVGVFDQLFTQTLTAVTVKADEVYTNKLCLEDICITRTELQTLLQNAANNTPEPEPPPSDPDPEPEPPPSDPEPEPEPEPEPPPSDPEPPAQPPAPETP